jgi:PAS domain-containing protein
MSNNRSSGNSSPIGNVNSSMSDLQFGATLDALLDFDNIDTSTADGSSTDPLMQVDNTLSNKRNEDAMNAFLQQQQQQTLSGETPKPPVGIGKAPEFPVLQPIAQSSQFPVPQPVLAQHQQLAQQIASSMLPSMLAMSALPSVPYGSLAMQQQQQQQQQQLNSSHQMAMHLQQQQNMMIALSLQQMAPSLHAASAPASNAPSMSVPMKRASPATATPSYLSDASSIRSYNNKRAHGMVSAISDDEGNRKRSHRNVREQQRSQQITTQIAELRHLLHAANVDFEKADKYSTLVTVGEFIKQLQDDATQLEAEHGRLVETIKETSKIVGEQYVQANATSSVVFPSTSGQPEEKAPQTNKAGLSSINAIDYKGIFASCPFASAIASIDGRFLDCNVGFEEISGYSRHELLPLQAPAVGEEVSSTTEQAQSRNLSLFNVVKRDDMEGLFVAMSEILKRPMIPSSELEEDAIEEGDMWLGNVEFCLKIGQTVSRKSA